MSLDALSPIAREPDAPPVSPEETVATSMTPGVPETPAQDPEAKRKKAIIEAVLFSYGAPIAVRRIAGIMELSEDATRQLLEKLREDLEREGRGIRMLRAGEEVELGSWPEATPWVQKLFKEDFKEELTPASLETLAIVAYRAPISRAEIDFIRGVNSSFILRSLLIRGLITRDPDPHRHNVFLYKPSFDLLKLLGVTAQEELPDHETLSKKISELAMPEAPEASNVPSE
ncbi:MAG: SMC-Scp complex subunit ScpB [Deltaproteobacteria bacterium]|nr:SMC-Scp complex subunit ScpB [Deltaproteobacteria bacterium]